jgi:hypothetical protein
MVSPPMREPSPSLDALVQLMSSRIDERGNWHVRSEELIAALEVDSVPFWRAVHASRDRIGFAEAVDGFSQDSAGDLVTVLERFYGPQAEQALIRAGLFLPHELRIELMEELYSLVERSTSEHRIGEDELAAMIGFAGSVGGAIPIYLGEHADLDALIDECAAAFAAARGMPSVGRVTAARCLGDFVRRHLIEKRTLFAGLERRLRHAARRLGYPDTEAEDWAAGSGPGERAAPARTGWALGVLGLSGAPLRIGVLRRRYRELMKRFHPDVNPSGLERCKDINAAYALLLSQAEQGGRGC